MKNHPRWLLIMFSDVKNWHFDMHVHCRNTHYLAKEKTDIDPSICFVAKNKFLVKAMSFGLVGTDGFIFKPVWINRSLNSARYMELLDKMILPTLDEHYCVGNYTLQQDGAPCHTSKATQQFLEY